METTIQNPKTIWSKDADLHSYPMLTEDIEVDVAIVGGGITGISTAYTLSKAGKKVALLEASQIGMGGTLFSSGNLHVPIEDHLYSITSIYDEKVLKNVVCSRMASISFIEARIQEFDIDCDFKRVPFFLFSTPNSTCKDEKIDRERLTAIKAGLRICKHVPENFPFPIQEFALVPNQAQFHPLKYVQQLGKSILGGNCAIYENSPVIKVEKGRPCQLYTRHGKVQAEYVIMANHSLKNNFTKPSALKPNWEHALVVKIKGDLPPEGIYWETIGNQCYGFRSYSDGKEDFLMVFGESQCSIEQDASSESFKKLEAYIKEKFEVASIDYFWSTQTIIPEDGLPYIGKSPVDEHVYLATGFASDGLIYGTLSAMIICDDIMGVESNWGKTYRPGRKWKDL